MRVFDALTGRLIKVFTNLNDDQMSGELTNFCLGSRERKMLVVDNIGLCRLLNVNNGELIQKVVKVKHLKDRAQDQSSRKKSYVKKSLNNFQRKFQKCSIFPEKT